MVQALEEIEDWVGQRLPEAYRTFIAGHEDDLQVGPLVVLYGRAYLVELNEAHQSKTNCPQYITIGNDSGGREILLALKNAKVGLVDAGSMNPADAHPVPDDFGTWLAGGCDLRDPPETPHPDRIDVNLQRPHAEGLKGLLRVLKLLDLHAPVSEYRGILANTPHRLAAAVDYLPYSWLCAEYNLTDPCLSASEVDQPGSRVQLVPRAPVPPPPGLDLP